MYVLAMCRKPYGLVLWHFAAVCCLLAAKVYYLFYSTNKRIIKMHIKQQKGRILQRK